MADIIIIDGDNNDNITISDFTNNSGGGGDMYKSVYDTDNDGVVNKSLSDSDGNIFNEYYATKNELSGETYSRTEADNNINNSINQINNTISGLVIQYKQVDVNLTGNTITILSNNVFNITNSLSSSNTITINLDSVVNGYANEYVLNFTTTTTTPTLVYNGFTPLWIGGVAISLKANKSYTIIFEKINGIVKTCWGEF